VTQNHVAAVREPAQQFRCLGARLPIELPRVGLELVGQVAHQLVHLRRVGHRVPHVVEHLVKRRRQLRLVCRIDDVDLDVHPGFDERPLGNFGIVVDVGDAGELTGLVTGHHKLRVQDALDGVALPVELGAHRVDQIRRIRGDDVDRRRSPVHIDEAQQHLVGLADAAERERVARQQRQRAAGPPGQLTSGVRQIAAGEDVEQRVLRLRHVLSPRCDGCGSISHPRITWTYRCHSARSPARHTSATRGTPGR
jgi:hypothetical protein